MKNLKLFFFIIIHFTTELIFAQQIDIDFNQGKKNENTFSFKVIEQGIIGISSIGHIDSTIEVVKIKYGLKEGFTSSFSLFTTKTLLALNKNDKLNTFSHIINPTGGAYNATIMNSFPLRKSDKSNSHLGLRIGKKIVKGQAIYNSYKNKSFFENFLSLGYVYKRIIAEEAIENNSLYLWSFPNIFITHASEEKRKQFFDNYLKSYTCGYGFELGIQYNQSLKIILIGNQILNGIIESELNKFNLRLSLAYRFTEIRQLFRSKN
jgi:hypothetical protein